MKQEIDKNIMREQEIENKFSKKLLDIEKEELKYKMIFFDEQAFSEGLTFD